MDSDGKPLTKREAKERGRCKDAPVAMKDQRRLERILTVREAKEREQLDFLKLDSRHEWSLSRKAFW